MTGVPFGMYLNTFLPIIKWSPVMMILAFILTTNWRNFLSSKFPLINDTIKALIVFQLIIFVYELIWPIFDTQYISFTLFIIAISLSLSSLNRHSNFASLPYYVFVVSLPLLLLGTYVSFKGMVIGEKAYMLHQESDNFVIEPFTVCMGAFVNMIAALCMNKKNLILQIAYYSSIFLGLYILLVATKRTPLVYFLICMLYFVYVKEYTRSIIRKVSWIYFVVPIIIGVISYFTIPFLEKSVDYFVENTYSGILNLFGDTSVKDSTGTAYIRVENRYKAYKMLESINVFSLIFGKGYNYIGQIDNPLLQMFVEMGILGSFSYLYFIVFVPIRMAIKKNDNNSFLLSLLWSFHAVLSIMNSGNPYMWNKWVPVVLLLVIDKNLLQREKVSEKIVKLKRS